MFLRGRFLRGRSLFYDVAAGAGILCPVGLTVVTAAWFITSQVGLATRVVLLLFVGQGAFSMVRCLLASFVSEAAFVCRASCLLPLSVKLLASCVMSRDWGKETSTRTGKQHAQFTQISHVFLVHASMNHGEFARRVVGLSDHGDMSTGKVVGRNAHSVVTQYAMPESGMPRRHHSVSHHPSYPKACVLKMCEPGRAAICHDAPVN